MHRALLEAVGFRLAAPRLDGKQRLVLDDGGENDGAALALRAYALLDAYENGGGALPPEPPPPQLESSRRAQPPLAPPTAGSGSSGGGGGMSDGDGGDGGDGGGGGGAVRVKEEVGDEEEREGEIKDRELPRARTGGGVETAASGAGGATRARSPGGGGSPRPKEGATSRGPGLKVCEPAVCEATSPKRTRLAVTSGSAGVAGGRRGGERALLLYDGEWVPARFEKVTGAFLERWKFRCGGGEAGRAWGTVSVGREDQAAAVAAAPPSAPSRHPRQQLLPTAPLLAKPLVAPPTVTLPPQHITIPFSLSG